MSREAHTLILAMSARLNGVWDDPALVEKGPLHGDPLDDIRGWVEDYMDAHGVPVEDLIPRQQRLAAVALLSAVDMPADAMSYARTLMAASEVCDGVTIGLSADMPVIGSRREGLMLAKRLIDAMLLDVSLNG